MHFVILGLIGFTVLYIFDDESTRGNVKSCLQHTYSAQNCTEAATCTKCGQVKEGSNPLGHDWVEGICTRCGIRQSSLNDESHKKVFEY